MNYLEFIRSKIEQAPVSGFDIDTGELHLVLLPHQRDIVKWLVKGGRRALFASFGLGKTIMEPEYCRIITKHEHGKALLIMPLGVKQEFVHDAVQLLGMSKPVYVTCMQDIKACDNDIMITNYERVRDGDIDPSYFAVVSLDEASVLRSFGSKVYQTFIDKFKGVKYKIVATATPSPNRYKELIHYASFLEIMDTGQALTRFFKRDSTKANNLTLLPAQEDEFWMWMSSWAIFVTKPSDVDPQYSDAGYDLPEMDIRWHKLKIEHGDIVGKNGEYQLYQDAAGSLQDAAQLKRESLQQRIDKAKMIIDAEPGANFVVWHDLEDERKELKKAVPETVDIYGSMDIDTREQRIIDFSEGRTRIFTTKKSMSGSGCNFQKHCHRAVFLGIDYKFNDFIQAIHRIYRFLQQEQVIIDVIYTEDEENIKTALLEKWKNHDHLVRKMGVGCPEYILLFRKIPTDRSNAYADEPVTKSKEEYGRAQWQIDAHGYWRSSGDRLLAKKEILQMDIKDLQKAYRKYSRSSVYDYHEHCEIAQQLDIQDKLPASFMVVAPGSWTDEVWDDINRMRTLNTEQSRRQVQMHVCPLQLDIVERIINRYSNTGDTVLDPFAGLFTVPMMAVKMGRKGYGIELSQDYFRDGVGYCKDAQDQRDMPSLFDFTKEEKENE